MIGADLAVSCIGLPGPSARGRGRKRRMTWRIGMKSVVMSMEGERIDIFMHCLGKEEEGEVVVEGVGEDVGGGIKDLSVL